MRIGHVLTGLLLIGVNSCAFAIDYSDLYTLFTNNRHGAFAHARISERYGYGYDYPTQQGADRRALNACGYGCVVISRFINQCAAYATGSGTTYGWATADSLKSAEIRAIEECNGRDGNCEIRMSVCTTPHSEK